MHTFNHVWIAGNIIVRTSVYRTARTVVVIVPSGFNISFVYVFLNILLYCHECHLLFFSSAGYSFSKMKIAGGLNHVLNMISSCSSQDQCINLNHFQHTSINDSHSGEIKLSEGTAVVSTPGPCVL